MHVGRFLGDRRSDDHLILAHHGLRVVALQVGVLGLHHPRVGIGRVRDQGVLGGLALLGRAAHGVATRLHRDRLSAAKFRLVGHRTLWEQFALAALPVVAVASGLGKESGRLRRVAPLPV